MNENALAAGTRTAQEHNSRSRSRHNNNITHHNERSDVHAHAHATEEEEEDWVWDDARPILKYVAFCLGDMRDGMTMLNMQSFYLLTRLQYNPTQISKMMMGFGLCNFLSLGPAGYLYDYTPNKIKWLQIATVVNSIAIISVIVIASTIELSSQGTNITLVNILLGIKCIQGVASAIIPTGLNSITLGVVGLSNFTHQHTLNRMYAHLGSACIVLVMSLLGSWLYTERGGGGEAAPYLFIASPLIAILTLMLLNRIRRSDVDIDAARGLIVESPTILGYELGGMDDSDEEDNTDDEGDNFFVDALVTKQQQQQYTDQVSSQQHHGQQQQQQQQEQQQCIVGVGNNLSTVLTQSSSDRTVEEVEASQTGHSYVPPQISPQGSLHPKTDNHNKTTTVAHFADQPPAIPNSVSDHSSKSSRGNHRGRRMRQLLARGKRMRKVPSYILGTFANNARVQSLTNSANSFRRRALTPLQVMSDSRLLMLTYIQFLFHLSNTSITPLIMVYMDLDNSKPSINMLLSGSVIFIAQGFMVISSKFTGDYSPLWGRKPIALIGFFSLPLRCLFLIILLWIEESLNSSQGNNTSNPLLKGLILSTQLIDAMGMGIVDTVYILVASDISAQSGRFSLLIGITSAAGCLGGTISSYIGQSMAHDVGLISAIALIGIVSLVPAFLYLTCMPETLPDYAKYGAKKGQYFGWLKRGHQSTPPDPNMNNVEPARSFELV